MSNPPTADDRSTDTETEQTDGWQTAVVDAIQRLEGYGDPGGDWDDKHEFQMKAAHDRLARLDTSDAPRDAAETIRDVVDLLAETPNVAPDEHGIIAQTALADLAPLAARAARERPPTQGTAIVDDQGPRDELELDVELEDSDDPLRDLNRALVDAERPPWRLQEIIRLDKEIAERYRPAFEQALEESETRFYELVYNNAYNDQTFTIDGYTPEYYFEHRSPKVRARMDDSADDGDDR